MKVTLLLSNILKFAISILKYCLQYIVTLLFNLPDCSTSAHNEIRNQDFYQVRSRWWLIWLMSWRPLSRIQLSRLQLSGRSSFLFRLKTFFVLDRWLYISRLCTMLLDSIKTLEFIKTMFWPNTNACFLILNDVVPPKAYLGWIPRNFKIFILKPKFSFISKNHKNDN